MNEQSPFLNVKERLFENEVGFVIYDKFPVNEGHCLIVPHRVYSDYFDSTPEEIQGLNELLFKTKEFLDKKYNPTGFNVGVKWTNSFPPPHPFDPKIQR